MKQMSNAVYTSGDQTIAGTKTFSSTIGGSITGNAATASKWETTRTLALTGNVTAAATNIDGTGNVSLSTTVANNVITNAMVNSAAAIADSKLATISTAGKVSNSATTATSANTANAIVARDASGNFSAGTISATQLTGFGVGTNYVGAGSGHDNATLSQYNMAIRSWWGIGFPSYDNVNRIVFDTRSGAITANTFTGALSQTLTRGTYLTGNNFNGSAATTWAVDATVDATVSKVVARDGSGDINCRLVRPNFANESTISGAIAYRVNNSTNNYVRFCSDTGAIRTFLDVPTRGGGNASGTWGINITGSAGSVPTASLPVASTSAAGIVQLTTATNSTSTTLAATASAVKAAMDAANAAQSAASATYTYGGIGSYAFLQSQYGAYNREPNGTLAGNFLAPAGVLAYNGNDIWREATAGTLNEGYAINTGTWRCMGTTSGKGNPGDRQGATLWIRIA